MRPRLQLLRRELAQTSSSPSSSSSSPRTFTQSTAVRAGLRTRPQLPFLSVPTSGRAHRVRYLTTEHKARLKHEIKLGIKITVYIWIAAGCLAAGAFAISQESLERQYPTPHEWTFLTRMRYRGAHCERDQTDPSRVTDWLAIMQWIQGAVERLENLKVDGRGLRDAPSDRPHGTKDITAMPESWRRGYYEAMMMYAKASERVDGWVLDKSRNIVFPPEMMVGPSNPRPQPIPPGYKGAPKEVDCETIFESPNDIYMRILSTEGLTARQKMDAGLAYASWLEFKGITGPANIIYEDAVHLAASEREALPDGTPIVDPKTWTLNEAAGPPSQNLLTSLTAYATFRARHGDLSSAFPILVSLLKARRSLPTPDATSDLLAPSQPTASVKNFFADTVSLAARLVLPPAYPPAPDDGTSPPLRDPKELCEEAALSLHIGEILYSSQAATREEGLGWTREAVDIAEEQLHKLGTSAADKDARTTCRDCLATGLGNWAEMVSRLAREEAAAKEALAQMPPPPPAKTSSWFGGLWGEGVVKEQDHSRWAAEEKVIVERERRAKELLDELEPPANGLSSIFSA
ncbi:hypothetical protein B0T22DRAFT_45925 [Podospora appendiculata]|uniref:MFS maltose permease n=1 Tax=Podospora appendiculata TaxID=314037 RepID=A0AAE1CGT7_9PEZI|nr:hypothetical protein B0T22DRAFT_45925 [Podospora appendiculata]